MDKGYLFYFILNLGFHISDNEMYLCITFKIKLTISRLSI